MCAPLQSRMWRFIYFFLAKDRQLKKGMMMIHIPFRLTQWRGSNPRRLPEWVNGVKNTLLLWTAVSIRDGNYFNDMCISVIKRVSEWSCSVMLCNPQSYAAFLKTKQNNILCMVTFCICAPYRMGKRRICLKGIVPKSYKTDIQDKIRHCIQQETKQSTWVTWHRTGDCQWWLREGSSLPTLKAKIC